MLNEFPLLNGIAPSFCDISVKPQVLGLGGLPGVPLLAMADIAAINTGVSVDIGEQRGPGGFIRRRTSGQPSYTASLELYRSGYDRFLEQLAPLAPNKGPQKRVSLVHFNIVVQHTPPLETGDLKLYEFRIKGARMAGRDANSAEGPDPDKVTVPLSVSYIADVINGIEILMV